MRFEITVKMAFAGDPILCLKTGVTHFECVGYKRCIFEQDRVVSESKRACPHRDGGSGKDV